jgi:hypothetical protein
MSQTGLPTEDQVADFARQYAPIARIPGTPDEAVEFLLDMYYAELEGALLRGLTPAQYAAELRAAKKA